MSTNYPVALDDWTNPVASPPGTENLSSMAGARKHSEVVSALQDAVEALEAKVGVDSSAVTTSLDYLISQLSSPVEEVPSGAINGVNAAFSISSAPTLLMLYLNGLKQKAGTGNDFTINGSTITFESNAIPRAGDSLFAVYF